MQRVNTLSEKVRCTTWLDTRIRVRCSFTNVALFDGFSCPCCLLISNLGGQVWALAKLTLLMLEACIICRIWTGGKMVEPTSNNIIVLWRTCPKSQIVVLIVARYSARDTKTLSPYLRWIETSVEVEFCSTVRKTRTCLVLDTLVNFLFWVYKKLLLETRLMILPWEEVPCREADWPVLLAVRLSIPCEFPCGMLPCIKLPCAPWLSVLLVDCVMTIFEFFTMKLFPEPILNFKV